MNKPKVKNRLRYNSDISYKIKDIDDKGTVIAYISAFNNKDKVGDIVLPTAFNKTIKENYDEIYHYLNHDRNKTIGIIKELKADDFGLLMTSQLMLKTVDGAFAYEWYKTNAELNKQVKHSIGYSIVDYEYKEIENVYLLKELFLVEGSTLTTPPANSNAIGVSVKDLQNYDIDYLLTESKFFDEMLKAKMNDIDLKKLEQLKINIDTEIKSRKTEQPDNTTVANALNYLENLKNINL